MAHSLAYRPRRSSQPLRLFHNRYVRTVLLIILVVLISSFYVYQRIWVRRLVRENETIQKQTEQARLELANLQQDWAQASALASVESALQLLNLGLRPTLPTQNLSLPMEIIPDSAKIQRDPGRYASLAKAIDKLKSHLPLVKTNEAEAKGITEGK